MKKKIAFLALLAIFSFGVGFVSNPPEKFVNVSAEWEREPSSVTDFFDMSDTVLIGKANVKKTEGEIKTIQPFDFDETLIYTEYDFEIISELKGEVSEKNISVINYGGENDKGELTLWEGIETIKDGDMYLLFLDEINEQDEADKNDLRYGKYRPIPPAGIFKVTSNNKNALMQLNTSERVHLDDLQKLDLELTVEDMHFSIQEKIILSGLESIIEEATQQHNGNDKVEVKP